MGSSGIQLTVYEQLGYLLVGYPALLVIGLDGHLLSADLPISQTLGTVFGLIAAYVLGNLIQTLANIFVYDNKGDFSPSQKTILKRAAAYFKVSNSDNTLVFKLCHLFVLEKQRSGQVTTFNAMYGMYRGWLVIAAAQVIVLIVLLAAESTPPGLVMLCLSGFAVATALLRQRADRFSNYFREKVILGFVVLQKV